MSFARVRFIDPVDASAIALGQSQSGAVTRDLSPYGIPPGAEAVLIRVRKSRSWQSPGVLFVAEGGGLAGGIFPGHTKVRCQSNNGAIVPDSLVSAADFWVRVDDLNQIDMQWGIPLSGMPITTQTYAILAYGEGGKCFEPMNPPVDISSIAPGATQTTPLTRDLTPFLPAGVSNVAAVVLRHVYLPSSGTVKHAHTRPTGFASTSPALTQYQGQITNGNFSRLMTMVHQVDSNNQLDLWWDNTNGLLSNVLLLDGYYLEDTRS